MEGGRAPLREARLDEAEARRAECREAARLLARRNAELLCRQRRADRDAAAVLALLTEQGREKAAQVRVGLTGRDTEPRSDGAESAYRADGQRRNWKRNYVARSESNASRMFARGYYNSYKVYNNAV